MHILFRIQPKIYAIKVRYAGQFRASLHIPVDRPVQSRTRFHGARLRHPTKAAPDKGVRTGSLVNHCEDAVF